MHRKRPDTAEAVTFQDAQKLLNIRPRRRQQLIKAGELQIVGGGHKRKVTLESICRYAGWTERDYAAWKQGLTFRQAANRLKIGPRQRQKLIRAGRLRVVGRGRHRRVTLRSVRRYDEQRRRARRARYGWANVNYKGWIMFPRDVEKHLNIGPRQRQKLAKAGKLQVVDGGVTSKSVRRYAARRRKKAHRAH